MALINELKKTGKTAVVINTGELAAKIGETYGLSFEAAVPMKRKLQHIERSMIEADVLLLDDLGIESGFGSQIRQAPKDMQDMLYRVTSKRYAAKNYKVTITTTNDDKATLQRKFRPQIISRLLNINSEYTVDFTKLKDVRGF